MTANSVGVVLVRLFSIYLAINALQTFFFFLPNMFTPGVGVTEGLLSASFWFLALAILLPAVCAFWLWRNVEVVVPEEEFDEKPQIDVSHAMLLGVSLMGLWLLVWGVISLVRIESGLAATPSVDDGLRLAQRAPYFAQILIALPLIFARNRISTMLLWARYGGRKKD